MNDNPSFFSMYQEIKGNYEELPELNEQVINSIENDIKIIQQNNENKIYIASVCIAVIFFIAYPLVLFSYYKQLDNWYPSIKTILSFESFFTNNKWSHFYFFLIALSILCYTVIMPHPKLKSLLSIIHLNNLRNSVFDIKWNFPFRIFACVTLYLSLVIPFIYLVNFSILPDDYTDFIIKLWIMIIGIFLCFSIVIIPLMLVIILLQGFLITNEDPSNPSRAIVYSIIYLLYKLKDHNTLSLINSDIQQETLKIINKIAVLIRNLYHMPINNEHQLWAKEQTKIASFNFSTLSLLVYFPQSTTLEDLKAKLIKYLNIFITGNFNELPRDLSNESTLSTQKTLKNQIKSYLPLMMFALYSFFPLIIYSLLITVFHIAINPVLSPLLGLLYTIWICLGFIAFADNISLESKNFVKEIITTVIQKNK
jgi:hypothetical protein